MGGIFSFFLGEEEGILSFIFSFINTVKSTGVLVNFLLRGISVGGLISWIFGQFAQDSVKTIRFVEPFRIQRSGRPFYAV